MQQPFKSLNGKLKVMVVRHHDGEAPKKPHSDTFHKISSSVSSKVGSPIAFCGAFLLVIVWAISGPLFNFSNTWQLVINTGTTIVTFLMVFVIQNSQNRDSRAMQLKLDELINATKTARTEFVDVETLSDTDLDQLQEEFKEIHEKLQKKAAKKKTV